MDFFYVIWIKKNTDMKPILIIFFGSFIFSNAIGQVPVEVTPTIQKKIIQNIEKEIPRFKQQLEKEKASLPEIEFTLDTFRVERFIQVPNFKFHFSFSPIAFPAIHPLVHAC